MLLNHSIVSSSDTRQKLRSFYRKDENKVLDKIIPLAEIGAIARSRTWERARQMIVEIRRVQSGKGGVDALLQEFAISSDEGVVLMCLAEALLRVPDKLTADELIRDKLSGGDWISHIGQSDSIFVNASSWGLLLTGKLVNYRKENKKDQFGTMKKMVGRLGEPVIRTAVRRSMELMGSQFVMGVTINKALKRAKVMEAKGYTYSYDMLGEGARTMEDADKYFDSYMDAIQAIGEASKGRGPINSPGISIKLSALHPRYEFTHYDRVMNELVPRLKTLAMEAKKFDIGFTVDAEEADRLDISLDVIQAVFSDPDLGDWQGFGMAVQAYQKRAIYVIDWINELTQSAKRKMMVRLVKGAYWDTEIKNSQAEGFEGFPVFSRKASTDVSYQACAKKLLEFRENIYPQFASHNAYTVSTILEMNADTQFYKAAGNKHRGFEFQRLHGMGESLFDQVVNGEGMACRVYAPVGAHVDLLAYLVRRLLENGANSSFVNNIVDEKISVESLLVDPFETVTLWEDKRNSQIALPANLYGTMRKNSIGLDLTDCNRLVSLESNLDKWMESIASLGKQKQAVDSKHLTVINPADHSEILAILQKDDEQAMLDKLNIAQKSFHSWSQTSVNVRADLLNKMADSLEKNIDELMAICIKEAGKTAQDSVAEVREAVDFCRYYANQSKNMMQGSSLSPLKPLGVVLCISPWNFPLAIFLGQVSAAIACGNTVVAKPAEQTSLVAVRAVELLVECGMPEGVVSLLQARGSQVGKIIVPDERIKAVMFTGSTEVGSWMAKTLAERGGSPIPLIAETGGQNCMIVDSTALPEQVVDDVIASGFQSAGQRCSAMRVLFVQDGIADKVIKMIVGAMKELKVGDPSKMSTDVGPVIDFKALTSLQEHAEQMKNKGKLLYQCDIDEASSSNTNSSTFFAPRLYEIKDLSVLEREIFGPCVHVIRFKPNELENVMTQIKNTRFGLTMGIHSRIGEKCRYLAERSVAGNIYVNRNMIGAIVGVQPFGGRGLSGTGPKAGGPNYLTRLVSDTERPQTKILSHEQLEEKNNLATLSSAKDSDNDREQIEKQLSALDRGFNEWRYEPVANRVSVMRQLLAHLSTNQSVIELFPMLGKTITKAHHLLMKIENVLSKSIELPGPTGESNSLSFEPRGVIMSLFEESMSTENWLLSFIATLTAGNTMVAIVEENKSQRIQEKLTELFLTLMNEIGLNDKIFSVLPLDNLSSVMSSKYLAGSIVDIKSDWQGYLTQKIAQREGEILPVICELNIDNLYHRLVTEKTISIDTTAAGGNTSLMTMSDVN
ncbi:MAG: RHH-type proline utilization regulon transcriptional repressor/proline dehydrogenase [Polaribacter sp.]|jgi:RHH-type proline utilization regulon transcriptional repressor/proline dehydrogenase/delta 1-pyrroline-5-carboxylate dehydrogenase